ncbi:MAG: FKBP-type peptidyl-prolyl cis-trans isomerase SlyD [bacterium]|jgi:FKBP-type peptidyl-prolyl cis-trans isomerase SlyD
MEISDKAVVGMDYTLTDQATGNVLDSSDGGQVLEYLHGANNIIPGLEKALEGKKVGDHIDSIVAPEEAYGVRHDDLIDTVPLELFEGIEKIEIGMQFEAPVEGGLQVVTVTGVEGEKVTIDGNHPLAGMTLNFSVDVKAVREATADELENGRPHQEGGCCEHPHQEGGCCEH